MKPRRFPFRTKYLLELLKIDQGETREVHVRHHRVVGIRSDHIQRSSEGERVLRWQRRKNYFPMLRTKQTTRSFESTQMSPARVITTNFRSWLGMRICNLVHWRRNSDKITSSFFFFFFFFFLFKNFFYMNRHCIYETPPTCRHREPVCVSYNRVQFCKSSFTANFEFKTIIGLE